MEDTPGSRDRWRITALLVGVAAVIALGGLSFLLANAARERDALAASLVDREEALEESRDRTDEAEDALESVSDELGLLGDQLSDARTRIQALGADGAEDGWGYVEVDGDDLPRGDASDGNDPAIGMTGPSVVGHDWDGNTYAITADGRPKLIVFLAHWCPHCQAEVPELQAWVDAGLAPSDIDIYAITSLTEPSGSNWPPQDWLRREGWTLPVLMDDSSSTIGVAYGLTGVPYYVLLSGENRVLMRVSGRLSSQALEALLDLARAGA